MNIRVFIIITCLISTMSCSLSTKTFIEDRPQTRRSYFIPNSAVNVGHENKNRNLIVFIHGVMGDPEGTWRNDDTKAYWPDIVANDCAFENYDKFVVSYYSPFADGARTIPQLGDALSDEMRTILKNYNNLVVVAHSMGNLVFRQAAYINNTFDDVPHVLLLSMGSPSNGGGSLANLAAMVSENPEFRDMIKLDYNSYLQTLKTATDFSQKPNIEIACAYEQRKVEIRDFGIPFFNIKKVFGKLVVDQGSATAVCSRKQTHGINADHFDMVKPRNAEDEEIYGWVKNEINVSHPLKHRIVVMDNFNYRYQKDEANLRAIQDYLKSHRFNDAKITEKTVYPNWSSYEEILKPIPPDLIVLHFSSLFDDDEHQPDRKKAFIEGWPRVQFFIKQLINETAHTKVLLYSRWQSEYHGLTLGEMQHFVENDFLKGLKDIEKRKFKERIFTFDVNQNINQNLSIKKGWIEPTLAGALEEKIVEILTGGTSLKECKTASLAP